jgi:hypothetical protein
MTRDGKRPPGLPAPKPGQRLPGKAVGIKGKGKGKSGKKDERHPETEAHAKEVREVTRGRDIVEKKATTHEKRPPAFDRKELMVVRKWLKDRPLEPNPSATAMIPFPRQWTTKRGRYCKFQAPGAGVYGLLRARPTF